MSDLSRVKSKAAWLRCLGTMSDLSRVKSKGALGPGAGPALTVPRACSKLWPQGGLVHGALGPAWTVSRPEGRGPLCASRVEDTELEKL